MMHESRRSQKSRGQKRSRCPRVSPHIEDRHDYDDFGLNHIEDSKVAAPDNGSSKMLVSFGKHFRVPANPINCLEEFLMEFRCSFELPGIIEIVRVPEILLYELEKLDRKASHFRASRRSSS